MNNFMQEQAKKDLYNSYKEQCLLSKKDIMPFDEWSEKMYELSGISDDVEDEKIPEKYICKYNFKLLKKKKTISLEEAKNFIGIELSTLKTYRQSLPSMTRESVASAEVRELLKERAKRDYRQYQKYCVSIGYLPASLTSWENGNHDLIESFGSEWVSINDASVIANSCVQTVERWVSQEWLYPHSECPFIVRKKDIEKIRDREKEENLIKCKECSKKMSFTSFLGSSYQGVCYWCSYEMLKKEEDNREAIARHCKVGNFLLVKDAGYINKNLIFSSFVSQNSNSNKFFIVIKDTMDREYRVCNNSNEVIEFAKYDIAMEVVRKLLK